MAFGLSSVGVARLYSTKYSNLVCASGARTSLSRHDHSLFLWRCRAAPFRPIQTMSLRCETMFPKFYPRLQTRLLPAARVRKYGTAG